MLALSTATEITTVVVAFFLLLALLTLLRLILRKEEPLWRAIRVGVFIERVAQEADDDEYPPPVRPPLQPTTLAKPE